MPELPEVETMRRGVEPIAGGRIAAVEKPRCSRKPITIEPRLPTIRKKLVGQRIAAVERLGKRLILEDRRLLLAGANRDQDQNEVGFLVH